MTRGDARKYIPPFMSPKLFFASLGIFSVFLFSIGLWRGLILYLLVLFLFFLATIVPLQFF